MSWLPYEALKDERTQQWPLVGAAWPVLLLSLAYLMAVWWLPRWMKKRAALQLRPLLVLYNMAMMLLNAHIASELLMAARRLHYSFLCQPHRVSHVSDELRVATAIWWFFFSKCLEFADTLFFALRKKTDQLSFLHVYHHSTMFPLWWVAVRWVPSGSSFFPALINAGVHVCMYAYYALSAVGCWPRLLAWKRHLTKMQLVQFVTGFVWAWQVIASGCDYPHWICYAMMAYMVSFLCLFGRFYARKYARVTAGDGREIAIAATARAARRNCN